MPPAVAVPVMATVPSKSVISSEEFGRATARSSAVFEIEARNAADRPSKTGGDQIKVKFSAPANTTVATVTELPEGKYMVEYTAPIAGTYQMSVTMNGDHISGSPFKITVTPPRAQAELCQLEGKALTRLTAGEIGTFTVGFIDRMGNQAPAEELDIRVKPYGSADLPQDENGDLIVPDKVQKTFKAFDEDGSGDIDFSELRQALAQMGMDGDRKATAVLLRRYDSDGGGLSIQEFTMLCADIELAQRTGYLLRGVVPSEQKGFRDVRYEVRVAGDYEMRISFAAASGGGALPGSPYKLTVHPAKASPETTVLPPHLAQGLKTAVGESGSFLLQAMDQYKNKSTRGGDRIRVAAAGALTATINDLADGTYEIGYHSDEAGVHRLSITVGDTHIQGSPLAVTCNPGVVSVPHCEQLHSGEGEKILAGTKMTLRIRARDRFGNETANVQGSGVDFTVELRRVPGEEFDVSSEAELAAGSLGKLESVEGHWLPGGLYEITYVPASRGVFHIHAVCVRDPEVTGISGENGEGIREDVAAFIPIPLVVEPLGPCNVTTSIVNASLWDGQILTAGTKLLMLVHARDLFGNACAWVGIDIDEPPLNLTAKLTMAGVALAETEAKPSILRRTPREEYVGVYDFTNMMSRSGRFTVDVTLDGMPIANSPLKFEVVATTAAGLKSLLFLPAAAADAEAADMKRQGISSPSPPVSPERGNVSSPQKASPEKRSPAKQSAELKNKKPDISDSGAQGEGGDGGNEELETSFTQKPSSKGTPLIGHPFRLHIKARDPFGNPVYRGGEKIDVVVVEPAIIPGSEADHMLAPKIEWQVIDQDTGTYYIDLTCANPGLHSITVRLGMVDVIGSPLYLEATRPRVLASMKAAGKSRGETLYACAAAIANAGVLWAFRHWEEQAALRADKMYIMRKAAMALLYADLRSCFQTWIVNGDERQHLKGVLQRAIRAVQFQWSRKGFNAWTEYSQSRSYNYGLLMRVIGSLQNQKLQRGFATWFYTLYPHKRKDALGDYIYDSQSFVRRKDRVEVRSVVPSFDFEDDSDSERD